MQLFSFFHSRYLPVIGAKPVFQYSQGNSFLFPCGAVTKCYLHKSLIFPFGHGLAGDRAVKQSCWNITHVILRGNDDVNGWVAAGYFAVFRTGQTGKQNDEVTLRVEFVDFPLKDLGIINQLNIRWEFGAFSGQADQSDTEFADCVDG